MSSNDSIKKIVTVAFALCIVCSIVVSTAAVILKPAQEANKDLDRKRNILAAAGMLEEGKTVDELKTSLEALRKEQFNLRFQKATGQLEQTGRIKQVRRDIARVKTIASQKASASKA